MKNPDPIARAWRLESRRKELGTDNPRCCYCPESDIECLEVDHPVTKNLDPQLKRVVCRNDHRKLELKRDLKGLTQNGRRGVHESQPARLRRYMLLLAEDQQSLAEVLLTRGASPEVVTAVAAAIIDTAESLRRKVAEAAKLEEIKSPVSVSSEPAIPLCTRYVMDVPTPVKMPQLKKDAQSSPPDDNHSRASTRLSARTHPSKR